MILLCFRPWLPTARFHCFANRPYFFNIDMWFTTFVKNNTAFQKSVFSDALTINSSNKSLVITIIAYGLWGHSYTKGGLRSIYSCFLFACSKLMTSTNTAGQYLINCIHDYVSLVWLQLHSKLFYSITSRLYCAVIKREARQSLVNFAVKGFARVWQPSFAFASLKAS